MKLILALLLLPVVTAFGRDTAYQALRVLGQERNQSVLQQVVEVKGFAGTPQPEGWLIVVDDPLARGGVRELEVVGGKVASERTPVKGYSGVTTDSKINFNKLNLDSRGAFTIAEQEAKLARVNFDAIDYLLRRDDDSGSPVWTLQLLDTELRRVGTLTIAADNGAVLSRSFDRSGRSGRSSRTTAGRGRSGAPAEPVEPIEIDPVDDLGLVEEKPDHIGRKIDRTFRRIGGSLEQFFTGRRTIDEKYREPEE